LSKAWGANLGSGLERISVAVTHWAGSSWGFAFALVSVLVWASCGPRMGYSPAWHLIINTGTTVITFLMVFLIERSQSKDARAIQLKLNELVAAMSGASNRLVAIEELSEQELELLHQRFRALADKAGREPDPRTPRSVDDSSEF
jgi:low affinity Fe/Cu permease